MKKKQEIPRRKKLQAAAVILVLVLCAAAALAAVQIWENRQAEAEMAARAAAAQEAQTETAEAEPDTESRTLEAVLDDADAPEPDEEDAGTGQIWYNGAWYALRDDLETVLLLGVDEFEEESSGGGYRNTQQADFLMLLIFDTDDETFTALHLNRDTMTDIQILGVNGAVAGTTNAQLALAHTYGSGAEDSCRNTVTAVSNLLYGMEIDHYISLTMDAVAILNDLVGGVTVEILDDFSDVDASLVQGETVTLRGSQALTYVRTRLGLEDSSNLHRMERQRQYLTALLGQLQSAIAGDTSFSLSTILEISEYLVSDCTITQLSDLANSMGIYDMEAVYTIDGEAVEGDVYMEYYVDEEALQDLILELFYEKQS